MSALLQRVVGRPDHLKVIVLLASIMSLSSADSGVMGSLAPQVERAFRIGNAQFGLLMTAGSLVGFVGAFPMGVLADRAPRVRTLVVGVSLWAVGMIITGLADSYVTLLLARVMLGVMTGVTGPVVASLTGDFFRPEERGRIYGLMLTGELLGGGGGIVVAGDLGVALGWRFAFFLLAVPSLVLAFVLHWRLPEPARGANIPKNKSSSVMATGPTTSFGQEEQERVVRQDLRRLSMWKSAGRILGVSSNRTFIISSALGYYFLSGVRSFGVLYARGQFHLSQIAVSLLLVVIGCGAIAGTVVSGRLSDRLISRGFHAARISVAAICFLGVPAFLVPGALVPVLGIALPLLVIVGVLLGAANPPLDSARLDVMPSALWGRAEAVRTSVRTLLEAFAPLTFGLVSQLFGAPGSGFGAGVNSSRAGVTPQTTHGLRLTFLVMVVPLAAGGVLLAAKRRGYLRDAAAAAQSEQAPVPARRPQ